MRADEPSFCERRKQLHLNTMIGAALQTVLDEMVRTGNLSQKAEKDMLDIFDNVFSEGKFPTLRRGAKFSGHLYSYRITDNNTTFLFDNFELKKGSIVDKSNRVKLVASTGIISKHRGRRKAKI
ncbi:hypothetical protein ACOME3_009582 [Neoechinorhynchus agilis]